MDREYGSNTEQAHEDCAKNEAKSRFFQGESEKALKLNLQKLRSKTKINSPTKILTKLLVKNDFYQLYDNQISQLNQNTNEFLSKMESLKLNSNLPPNVQSSQQIHCHSRSLNLKDNKLYLRRKLQKEAERHGQDLDPNFVMKSQSDFKSEEQHPYIKIPADKLVKIDIDQVRKKKDELSQLQN